MATWSGSRGVLGAAALLGVAAGMLGCGVAEDARSDAARADAIEAERCLGLAQEYADTLPDALLCDLASPPDTCAARRPVVIYEVDGSGRARLTGLSSCAAPVNAARTAKLDEVLGRYTAAGCDLWPTPCLWNRSPEMDAPPPCRARPDGVGSCNG
jgi:hypothetical protein